MHPGRIGEVYDPHYDYIVHLHRDDDNDDWWAGVYIRGNDLDPDACLEESEQTDTRISALLGLLEVVVMRFALEHPEEARRRVDHDYDHVYGTG